MPTRHAAQTHIAPFDLDIAGISDGELFTGERVCAPSRPVRRRSSWGPAFLVLTILGAGGFAIAKLPEAWRTIVIDQASALAQWAFAPTEQAPPPSPPLQAAAATPEPLVQQDIAPAAGAEAGTLMSEHPSELNPENANSAQGDDSAAPEPLAPPVADPADPLQKRALAAGLHPDLSRAVLARFSEADWRNAAYAVRTALAQTRDTEVRWPQAAVANTAQFEVRFVRAAGAACRRYVVSVIKDRWSTTAPAMELCGDALRKHQASQASASKVRG